VVELKSYLNSAGVIGLSEECTVKIKEQLSRFAQEIAFRKNEEEMLRKLEEDKKKKQRKR
jgi:hypothetical protein